MSKYIDYSAIFGGLLLVLLTVWITVPMNIRNQRYIILDNKKRTRVRIGSLKWEWYRIVLDTPIWMNWCTDCKKPIDSIKTDDLCTCAFELDMIGVDGELNKKGK